MRRLWLATCLIALGLAGLIVAPMAQSCFYWSDGQACETGGTIILNVVGGVFIVIGALLLWSRWREPVREKDPGAIARGKVGRRHWWQ